MWCSLHDFDDQTDWTDYCPYCEESSADWHTEAVEAVIGVLDEWNAVDQFDTMFHVKRIVDRVAALVPRPPDGMTADKLRYIAESLDQMDNLLGWMLDRVEGADEEQVASLNKIKAWLEGSEQQDDLRAWAAVLDPDSEASDG